jgi:hypothetical protein
MICIVCDHKKEEHTGKRGPGRACSHEGCLCDVFLASSVNLDLGQTLRPQTIFKDDNDKVRVVREWLQKLADEGVNLTPWETNFLKDIRIKAAFGIKRLTNEQVYWIEKIYTERTS